MVARFFRVSHNRAVTISRSPVSAQLTIGAPWRREIAPLGLDCGAMTCGFMLALMPIYGFVPRIVQENAASRWGEEPPSSADGDLTQPSLRYQRVDTNSITHAAAVHFQGSSLHYRQLAARGRTLAN